MNFQAWPRFLTVLCLLLVVVEAHAIPHRKSLGHKTNQFLREGVFIGGRSGMGATLLDVRRSYDSKARSERIVLDWGDQNAKPMVGSIGFFHVSVDAKNKRVVVDLSQVVQSSLQEAEILKRLKASPLIKSSRLLFDPYNVSTQLILEFKSPIAVETFYLVNNKDPSRLVLDVRPAGTGKKL